eukprot:TRINITY_DN8151_c0_g1_i1.p1 TRINITY_DN8151_c0_g1~~TRINITY_DN8151_c0_g1_i1.p1  ORF type:complete len:602 (-),score=277.24 TRINITY_DN8151_c0_g1_i1:43-1848(-)
MGDGYPLFHGLHFFLSLGNTPLKIKKDLSDVIKKNGGQIEVGVSKKTTHLVALEKEIGEISTRVKTVYLAGGYVVTPSFIDESIHSGRRADEWKHTYLGKEAATNFARNPEQIVMRGINRALGNIEAALTNKENPIPTSSFKTASHLISSIAVQIISFHIPVTSRSPISSMNLFELVDEMHRHMGTPLVAESIIDHKTSFQSSLPSKSKFTATLRTKTLPSKYSSGILGTVGNSSSLVGTVGTSLGTPHVTSYLNKSRFKDPTSTFQVENSSSTRFLEKAAERRKEREEKMKIQLEIKLKKEEERKQKAEETRIQLESFKLKREELKREQEKIQLENAERLASSLNLNFQLEMSEINRRFEMEQKRREEIETEKKIQLEKERLEKIQLEKKKKSQDRQERAKLKLENERKIRSQKRKEHLENAKQKKIEKELKIQVEKDTARVEYAERHAKKANKALLRGDEPEVEKPENYDDRKLFVGGIHFDDISKKFPQVKPEEKDEIIRRRIKIIRSMFSRFGAILKKRDLILNKGILFVTFAQVEDFENSLNFLRDFENRKKLFEETKKELKEENLAGNLNLPSGIDPKVLAPNPHYYVRRVNSCK